MGRPGKRSRYCNASFLEATPIVVVNDLSSVFNVYKHECCNYMMYKFIGDLLSCGMASTTSRQKPCTELLN